MRTVVGIVLLPGGLDELMSWQLLESSDSWVDQLLKSSVQHSLCLGLACITKGKAQQPTSQVPLGVGLVAGCPGVDCLEADCRGVDCLEVDCPGVDSQVADIWRLVVGCPRQQWEGQILVMVGLQGVGFQKPVAERLEAGCTVLVVRVRQCC